MEGNSFYQSAVFSEKKVLVIVPHMDDEINVAGSMIHNLAHMGCSLSVLYTTNGDSNHAGERRVAEAKRALEILVGADVPVIVMDYVDQARSGRVHKSFENRKHIEQEIKKILKNSMPDIIFCVDLDEHPDHMCTSLMFEKAMGELLKESSDWVPIIYKGFAYKTAYFSYDDIYQGGNPILETRCYGPLDNPMYNWEERVRFPVLRECRCNEKELTDNIIAKALTAHKTVNAISHMGRIINSDTIYFERRADSLSYRAKIEVSSGEEKYLNDFILLDVKDVMKRKCEYDNYLWIPEEADYKKTICMKFDEPIQCNTIVFYQNVDRKSRIRHMKIAFDDNTYIDYYSQASSRKGMENKSVITFETKRTESIKLSIVKCTGNAGISELEVYYDDENEYNFIKIIQNGNFVYSLITRKQSIDYRVYGYKCRGGSVEIPKEETEEKLYHNEEGEEFLRVMLKKNPEIYDEVPVLRLGYFPFVLFRLKRIWYRVLCAVKNFYNSGILIYKKCKMAWICFRK